MGSVVRHLTPGVSLESTAPQHRELMITGGNLWFEAGVTLNLCVISRKVCVSSSALCGCVKNTASDQHAGLV